MGAICTKNQSVQDPGESAPVSSRQDEPAETAPPMAAKSAWNEDDGKENAESNNNNNNNHNGGGPDDTARPAEDESGGERSTGEEVVSAGGPGEDNTGLDKSQGEVSKSAALSPDERPVGPGSSPSKDFGEADAEPVDLQLEPCPHCARKFAVDRIEKHKSVCVRKKSALGERGIFASARQRIEDIDDRQLAVYVRLEGKEANMMELEEGTLKELQTRILNEVGRDENSDIYLYITTLSGQIPLTSNKQLFYGAQVLATFSVVGASGGGLGGGLAPLRAPAALAPLKGAPMPPPPDKKKKKKKKKKKNSSRMKKLREEALQKQREADENNKWDLEAKFVDPSNRISRQQSADIPPQD